jgi:hypothetical protein
MKTFFVLNSDQDGDGFEVEADTRQEALEKALSELGWYVIEDDGEEENEEEIEEQMDRLRGCA